MKFAFYGRVSTEDQQDPQASRAWQLARATTLIQPTDGDVVAEFFDIGLSRSLPWKRRPQAARLLTAIRDPQRGFDAVVIGEPQRAFYGNQFGLTFPLFVHYNVQLWVPEVGGAVDPGSDAHDLVMALYGGMSKGERNRIKIRVRSAMASQAATEGRFLGGRPPYGYRLADAGPHPNPTKALDGRRLHQLEPDPATAPVVKRIFREYLAGRGLFAIAEALTADGILSPSAHDAARNPHRHTVAWAKGAVRVVLTNPRYTGRQVWNKQRKDEVLIDVEDVALGHETKMRWNDPQAWIWSAQVVHEPLISDDEFRQAQALLVGKRRRQSPITTTKRTRHPYQLRGMLFCGICQRRMQGSWNNDKPHYRCVYPTEYGLANTVAHPRSVYVREELIVPTLDRWLLQAFAPHRLPDTIAAMTEAQDEGRDTELSARADEARRMITDCDQRLVRYRAALEAGTDPKLIAGWTTEVNATRAAAEAQLRTTSAATTRMTTEQISALVAGLGEILTVLRDADPRDKAKIYAGVGLHLTYQPSRQTVIAEAKPPAIMYESSCPRGDLITEPCHL